MRCRPGSVSTAYSKYPAKIPIFGILDRSIGSFDQTSCTAYRCAATGNTGGTPSAVFGAEGEREAGLRSACAASIAGGIEATRAGAGTGAGLAGLVGAALTGAAGAASGARIIVKRDLEVSSSEPRFV